MDNPLAGTNGNVATGAATSAEALGLLKEPDPHLEAEILGGQRTHRTQVHGVERVIVVEFARFEGTDGVVGTAIHDAQRVVASNVASEADAPGAQDAALVIEDDAGTEIDRLGLVDLGFDKLTVGLAVLDRVFLKFALTGLVANGAIERMVDEQRLQHRLAHLLSGLRIGVNFHARRDRRGTSNGTARGSRLIGKN